MYLLTKNSYINKKLNIHSNKDKMLSFATNKAGNTPVNHHENLGFTSRNIMQTASFRRA
jgi:hypothetical protein